MAKLWKQIPQLATKLNATTTSFFKGKRVNMRILVTFSLWKEYPAWIISNKIGLLSLKNEIGLEISKSND